MERLNPRELANLRRRATAAVKRTAEWPEFLSSEHLAQTRLEQMERMKPGQVWVSPENITVDVLRDPALGDSGVYFDATNAEIAAREFNKFSRPHRMFITRMHGGELWYVLTDGDTTWSPYGPQIIGDRQLWRLGAGKIVWLDPHRPRPVRGPDHVDYPHEPGYLHDCPACEARCHCEQYSPMCVYTGRHRR